jgi:hypothetical protein
MSVHRFSRLPLPLAFGALLLGAPALAHAVDVRAAFSAECPTTKYPTAAGKTESGVIGAALAASLASALVDTGVATLKRAVNPGNATAQGRFYEDGLYAFQTKISANGGTAAVIPAPRMGCLVIAVGEFPVADDGIARWQLPFASGRQDDPSLGTGPADRISKALGIVGPAKLYYYMEAARMFSPDRTAVTWTPVRLYVSDYLNGSFFAGKARGALFEMRLYKPGEKEAFLAQDFGFDALKKPVDMGAVELFQSNGGLWNKLPAAPSAPAEYLPNEHGRLFDPFTLEVRLVETPKPYKFAIAFADNVEKDKDLYKKELTQALDSSARKNARLTGEGVTLDEIDAYLTLSKAKCTDPGKDANAKMSCSAAADRARSSLQKAKMACRSVPVSTCASLPSE